MQEAPHTFLGRGLQPSESGDGAWLSASPAGLHAALCQPTGLTHQLCCKAPVKMYPRPRQLLAAGVHAQALCDCADRLCFNLLPPEPDLMIAKKQDCPYGCETPWGFIITQNRAVVIQRFGVGRVNFHCGALGPSTGKPLRNCTVLL